MPNIKSAKKRARQNIIRRARNRTTRSLFRTLEKKIRLAIDSNSNEGLSELLKAYSSKISKAVTKGVVKKETASRKISRLSTKVFKVLQKPTTDQKSSQ